MERECYSSWVLIYYMIMICCNGLQIQLSAIQSKMIEKKAATGGLRDVWNASRSHGKNINIIDHMIRNLEQHCNCYNLLFVFRQVIFMARDGPLYACVHVCTCNDVHACMHVFASQVLNA